MKTEKIDKTADQLLKYAILAEQFEFMRNYRNNDKAANKKLMDVWYKRGLKDD